MGVLLLFVCSALSQTVKAQNCTYSICLFDDYGDGWDVASATVQVNGVTVLNSISLANGYGPQCYNFSVPAGATISVYYTAGFWPGENYYSVYNGPNGSGTSIFYSGAGQPASLSSFASGCTSGDPSCGD